MKLQLITMTPEEKFSQDVWAVLQKIKEHELYFGSKNAPSLFTYSTPDWIDEKIIEHQILSRLEEWGAIRDLKLEDGQSSIRFYIVQPKFDEIYRLYRGRNDNQEDNEDGGEDDCFTYDGGISSPYENTNLELFILKKILLEHKGRDDCGFYAKELSFNNNSLEEICRVINKLIEDKILYLSANTRPEGFEKKGAEGIKDKQGFINWKLVEKLDKNPQEMEKEMCCVIFDTDVVEEVKLKGRIDVAVEEFMNDKVYIPTGRMMDKADVDKMVTRIEQEQDNEKRRVLSLALKPKAISHPYLKQREIVIDEIIKDNLGELVVPLNNFRDVQVDVLKTLLALEKENLLRIKGLESNPMYDDKGEFIGEWAAKDNPRAKIQILGGHTRKQGPMPAIQDKYIISVKDREIWVNDYLIARPHATGYNLEFFDYVRHQLQNTKIELETISNKSGFMDLKNELKGRRFIKILNALGFKGEVKKAFFYKVGPYTCYYRGDKITKEDLEEAGVKIPLFLKELEVSHAKNCPE